MFCQTRLTGSPPDVELADVVRLQLLQELLGKFEVRTGAYVCRIERITYAWAHVAGARHINIIIEGLNLLEVSSSPTRKTTRHGQRSLTLADLKNGCGMKHRCLFSPFST